MSRIPEISVIIPALNEELYINNAISGLKRQKFKDFETIVVDGGSEDKTASIASKFAKVIVYTKKGAGSARNKGASIATGRILIFLDADTKPSPQLLQVYSEIFKNKDVVAATGPIYPVEKTKFRVRAGYKFVSTFFVRASILIHHPAIVGSNFAARRDVFSKSGGFNEKFITYEDWDLSGKLQNYGKVKYHPKAIAYTSARRVIAWGVGGYMLYYLINMMMYHILRRSRTNYKNIR